jgi:hypothetical protein
MFKSKILSLLLVTSIVTMPLAAYADEGAGCKKADPIIAWTIGLPFKAVGAALSSATGLLVGTTAGLFRGAVKGTKAVAGALGDEDGAGETLVGIILGAAPGAAIHAVVGGLLWGGKGFLAGWEKPFECESLDSALGGIPDAIEWTAEGAVDVFSA